MALFGLTDDQTLKVGGGAVVGALAGYFLMGERRRGGNSPLMGMVGAGIGALAGYYLSTGKVPFAGAFATTTTCPAGSVSIGTGQCYDFNSGQVFSPAQLYQYQQQYYPYQQQYYDPYQQYQYQQPSYSAYYPNYYQQQQQYYYPYQQQYTSPTTYYQYQQYTQQPQQSLSSCITTCMQMYPY